MFPLPPSGLRAGALAVILGAVLVSPRAAVEDRVTRADSQSRDSVGLLDGEARGIPPLEGVRLHPVAWGMPSRAPRCLVAVAYPDDLPLDRRIKLTDLVVDRNCPSELNTTVGLTFEIENPQPGRTLWWRRAESSFDVLYPSSGSLTAAGKNRVSLSSLVLDQTVTIEVLEGDQRLMSFTVKHF
jgi:hypothetical protein